MSDEQSPFVQSLIKEFYEAHRKDGFFSSEHGDGCRTLDQGDLEEIGRLAEQQLQKYEAKWIARVSQYIGALDDLHGQAQDEEDSLPEEAIDWARAQFDQIFQVTSTT